MRVIGAGWGRTGSTSLKAALEHLGFGPCYHMSEVVANPEHVPLWQETLTGRNTDLGKVFSGYQSTTDLPGSLFWRELAEAYPEAKVILTVRDPERWYESVRRTILSHESRTLIDEVAPGPASVVKLTLERALPEGAEDRDTAIRAFERHNQTVRDTVPADRLLVHEIGDGWEPVCDFLGVPVPDEPFPHLNDTASFRAMLEAEAKRVG